MNKGKLIVANWKMNFHYKNAFNFCKTILSKKNLIKNQFVICPPTTLILQLSSKFKEITFGAQDCHYEKFGAYTGDVSASMLKNFNCKYVLVGHVIFLNLPGGNHDVRLRDELALHHHLDFSYRQHRYHQTIHHHR